MLASDMSCKPVTHVSCTGQSKVVTCGIWLHAHQGIAATHASAAAIEDLCSLGLWQGGIQQALLLAPQQVVTTQCASLAVVQCSRPPRTCCVRL